MTTLLAFLSLLLFTPQVTKEDVKKLVAAGVSDDVIVTLVRIHGPVSILTADDLIELRSANVSEKVLSAMIEASKARPTTSPEPTETAPLVTYPYSWYYPTGYYNDYYYGPSFWWSYGPWYRSYPYYHHYGYPYRYYHYPYYRYGYHYAPRPYVKPHSTPPHATPAPRPPPRVHR